jgi:geranyl-CoA carboxylase beta subunit
MGGEQAARTMAMVQAAAAERKGVPLDAARLDALQAKIIGEFDRQMSVFATSARLLDDGVIDPRRTRAVLSEVLSICRDAERRRPQPMQFGVARP